MDKLIIQFILIFLYLGTSCLSWGQLPDQLTTVLPEMQQPSKGKQKKAKKKQEEDMSEQLSKLKNPFIPQLPSAPVRPVSSNVTAIATPQINPTQDQIPPPNYKISGLIWNTRKPQAILNGKIVQVGDKMEQWSIIHITKEGVEVSFQEQKFLIKPQGALNAQ